MLRRDSHDAQRWLGNCDNLCGVRNGRILRHPALLRVSSHFPDSGCAKHQDKHQGQAFEQWRKEADRECHRQVLRFVLLLWLDGRPDLANRAMVANIGLIQPPVIAGSLSANTTARITLAVRPTVSNSWQLQFGKLFTGLT
jgi:hypothetical protein